MTNDEYQTEDSMHLFLMRRFTFCVAVMLVTFSQYAARAEESLPVDSHPNALETPHFPDRLHAFVWRNWQLVELARIAKVVGTSAENIARIAESMGLPVSDGEHLQMLERGYITLIRRNWHLLSYDQLLALIGKTPEELAHILREDDFLYYKLGSLKPKCEPLRYQEPDVATRLRAADIQQLARKQFGDFSSTPAEPRFHFVEYLSSLEGTSDQEKFTSFDRDAPLRMVYSYFGLFGDPLVDTDIEPFPDGLLSRLAEMGVNGIWMHVVLRQLAPGGEDFPEFGDGHEQRLRTLKKLVEQAKRYGIGIYLYMNEPRAMPPGFFRNRPEMAGVRKGNFVALCTSDARVRKWLSDSLAYVFREIPELGGVFTITASENLTNCASHFRHVDCPRCRERADAAIIAEVNATIEEGVHRESPSARVIVWDWGWKRHGDASDTIARLPERVELMSVSEWALPIERGGVHGEIGEYSISAVGPGPRAKRHWALAKQRGLKKIAKVQFNNTWELSAVPFLPVLDLIAEHCENLANADVDGMMLSWTLGGYPSPNLQVAHRFATLPNADKETVLNAIATQRYGAASALHVRRAWTSFSDAFRQFPYHGSVMYQAPQQMGPANLLYGEPTGFRSTMVGIPYDDLERWRGPYSPEILAKQFEQVASDWAAGLYDFKQAVKLAPEEKRDTARADFGIARAAHLHFYSVGNQIQFVMAQDALRQTGLSSLDKQSLNTQIQQLLELETALAVELFAIVRNDSRIGFEASNHYYYVPLDLVEKVINCDFLRQKFGNTN